MVWDDTEPCADRRWIDRVQFPMFLLHADQAHRQRTEIEIAHNSVYKCRINMIGTEVFRQRECAGVDYRQAPAGTRTSECAEPGHRAIFAYARADRQLERMQ